MPYMGYCEDSAQHPILHVSMVLAEMQQMGVDLILLFVFTSIQFNQHLFNVPRPSKHWEECSDKQNGLHS